MAGGTSRKDHSEVGSSYIHFNFTPDGDKTTPSLIGDVPRGVMLRERPIFLGGQGGMVGPVRMGYGNVVAANSVIRSDYKAENKLIIGKTHSAMMVDIKRHDYPGLSRIIENNTVYVANLAALREWYLYARRPFIEKQEFGGLIFSGVLEKLSLATEERLKRLKMLAEKARNPSARDAAGRSELSERFSEIEAAFSAGPHDDVVGASRDRFLARFHKETGSGGMPYIEAVRAIKAETCAAGVEWLQRVVDEYCARVRAIVPSLHIFR
jgi:UDP-N-acetylglucosamine/UDP-N-acetylgalactosamine diphosphorylase